MNKVKGWLVAAILLAGGVSLSHADSVAHKLGVSGIAAASFPVGDDSVMDNTKDVGHDFGGMLRYGLTPHMSIGASYDNINLFGENGERHHPEAIMGNLLYHVAPDSKLVPTLQVGVGAASTRESGTFDNTTARAGLGLDFFFTPNFSIGPQVHYTFIANHAEEKDEYHIFGAGLMASLFFGGNEEAKPAPAAAAAPPPAAVPVAVALAVNPANAALGPGQVQSFSTTGANTAGVMWTLSPNLGMIDGNGTYTAPESIALAQRVRVTATSVTDGSNVASAWIQLNPPASAPQQVNMEMHILFDTGKSVVKPESRDEIQRVAEFMKTYPDAHAEIDGYTDNTGSAEINTRLSQERADSVRQTLIQQFGIDGSRLTAKGYGPAQPIAPNDTKEGRAKNRRVVAALTATK